MAHWTSRTREVAEVVNSSLHGKDLGESDSLPSFVLISLGTPYHRRSVEVLPLTLVDLDQAVAPGCGPVTLAFSFSDALKTYMYSAAQYADNSSVGR